MRFIDAPAWNIGGWERCFKNTHIVLAWMGLTTVGAPEKAKCLHEQSHSMTSRVIPIALHTAWDEKKVEATTRSTGVDLGSARKQKPVDDKITEIGTGASYLWSKGPPTAIKTEALATRVLWRFEIAQVAESGPAETSWKQLNMTGLDISKLAIAAVAVFVSESAATAICKSEIVSETRYF